jgi:hypothetical protein
MSAHTTVFVRRSPNPRKVQVSVRGMFGFSADYLMDMQTARRAVDGYLNTGAVVWLLQ